MSPISENWEDLFQRQNLCMGLRMGLRPLLRLLRPYQRGSLLEDNQKDAIVKCTEGNKRAWFTLVFCHAYFFTICINLVSTTPTTSTSRVPICLVTILIGLIKELKITPTILLMTQLQLCRRQVFSRLVPIVSAGFSTISLMHLHLLVVLLALPHLSHLLQWHPKQWCYLC